jgi:hypothetical protein
MSEIVIDPKKSLADNLKSAGVDLSVVAANPPTGMELRSGRILPGIGGRRRSRSRARKIRGGELSEAARRSIGIFLIVAAAASLSGTGAALYTTHQAFASTLCSTGWQAGVNAIASLPMIGSIAAPAAAQCIANTAAYQTALSAIAAWLPTQIAAAGAGVMMLKPGALDTVTDVLAEVEASKIGLTGLPAAMASRASRIAKKRGADEVTATEEEEDEETVAARMAEKVAADEAKRTDRSKSKRGPPRAGRRGRKVTRRRR